MMPFFLEEHSGEDISPEAKEEMLLMMWEWGMHIIPCGSPSEMVPQYFRNRNPFAEEDELKRKWAKTPRMNWRNYQKIQPSREEITQWHKQYPHANWAAITGINFVVVDSDSNESTQWIQDGNISSTPMTQSSPSGGRHFFYSAPTNRVVRNSVGQNKIDVRGEGGYIMVVPSYNYRMQYDESFLINDFDELPLLTEEDIQKVFSFNNDGKVVSLREKLTEEPRSQGSRNDTLARLVGKWIKEGWGMREILIKAQDWNQTCEPPLDLLETTRTTISIAEGHIKRHPEDVDAGVLDWKTSTWNTDVKEDLEYIQGQEDVQEPETVTSGPLGLKPFSDDEWTDLKTSTIDQYWGDAFIFEKSRVLLLGKPKIGKSNWLGAFAAGATTGTDFMEVPFSRPLKVMWFQAEIIAEFLKRRIEVYYRRFAADPEVQRIGYDNLIISGRLRKNLMRDADIQAFSDEIAFHKPDIVMIDPIINFFDGEENNNSDIRRLMDRIDMLMEMNNVSVILAHHTGKERADDKSFLSARGGSVFAGWFDSGIKLSGEKPEINLFYEARNAQEPEEHMAFFDFDEGIWKRSMWTPKRKHEVSEEDEVKIAQVVASAMSSTTFYKRKELEMLAREALGTAKMNSGERAAMKAVSYVQKYMGNVVKTHAEPGKAVWHYLASNEMQRPWEAE
ncbi:MAG: AAA family ATPase [Prochlorococcus sp. ALOHA_A2.0_51]|nr:AAA family ATPase [Prochlorococcus sp. ALOHA_A2.0_51]